MELWAEMTSRTESGLSWSTGLAIAVVVLVAAIAVDNIIRRSLRVSDPNNPHQL